MNKKIFIPVLIAMVLLFSAVPVQAFQGPSQNQAQQEKPKQFAAKFQEGIRKEISNGLNPELVQGAKQLRERIVQKFGQAKQLMGRVQGFKDSFFQARNRFLEAKGKLFKPNGFKNGFNLLQNSRELLESKIDRVISWIEAAQEKGIEIENPEELIASLNELKTKLQEDSLTLNEAIEVEKAINDAWNQAKPCALQSVGERFLNQFNGIMKQADYASIKARVKINQLGDLNADTSELEALLGSFNESIEAARTSLTEAEQSIADTALPEEKSTALQEANELLKQAHQDLQQAFKEFRKFFFQYRSQSRKLGQ